MCSVIEVNIKSYYSWIRRGISNRDKENMMVLNKIKEIRKDKKKKCYGSPKILL